MSISEDLARELGFLDTVHEERAEDMRQAKLAQQIEKINRESLDPEADHAKLLAEGFRELDEINENDPALDIGAVIRGGHDTTGELEKSRVPAPRARHVGLLDKK